MAENEVKIVVRAVNETSQGFDSARSSAKRAGSEGGAAVDGLSGKIKGLGAAAVASAALIGIELAKKAIGALIEYSKGAISAASDLNESTNAVDKVFKGNAKTIEDWGKTQAAAYGLSQRQFQEMATSLGSLLKNQGVKDFTGQTIELTKRAADMASVFNTTVPEALDALTAGLRGETDPLEKYGVSLTEAQVQAEALAETGKKTASQLTDQEKSTARLNLIMKQTSDTANDFKDTSDGLANSSRILAARQEELQATIGQKLLPVMNKLTQFKLDALEYIGTNVLPAVEDGAKKVFEAFRKVWEEALPHLQNMLENIKQAWEDNRDSIEKLKPLLEYLGIFLGVTLVAALIVVGGLVGGFIIWLGKAGDAFQQLKQAMDHFVVAIIEQFGKIIDGAAAAFGWIPGIGPKINAAKDAFHRATDGIVNDIKNAQAVAKQGIGVSIHVSGLSSLSQAIADVIWLSQHSYSAGISKAHAVGGIAGGLSEVGERGGEVLKLPQGTMVYSNANTNQMAMSGQLGKSGGDTIVNLYVQGSIHSERDIVRVIRDEALRGGFRGAFAT